MPSRRIVLALFLSLLLHIILLSGVNLEFPDLFSEQDRINVVLVPSKIIDKLAPVALPAETRTPQPVQPKPTPKPVPQQQPEQAPPAKPVNDSPAATNPQPAIQEPPVAEPANEVIAPPEPEIEESLALRGFKLVEIEYRLFRGKGGSIGTVKHVYRAGGEGNYSITATAEASGLVSLFVRGKFEQQSEGTIGMRGLKPWHFSYQRSENAAKNQKANFNWEAGLLTMETGQKQETVPLQEGVQDQLSFMYQFMFVPPLEEMQLAITNGKRLRTYTYRFDGEEILKTDIGDVRTLHISKRDNDGEGKLELWLAADYRYLPIKISQTEKDGTVTEQLVKQLKAE